MKKLTISLVVLILGVSSFLFFSSPNENDETGSITIVVINELEETVYHEELVFNQEDTLFDLLDEHLTVMCANASYQASEQCNNVNINGRIILGLDDVETDWYHSFIAIYVNDEYSEYGIDGIALIDDTKYRFEYTVVGGDNE